MGACGRAEECEDDRRTLFALSAVTFAVMLILPIPLGFSVNYASFWPIYSLAAIPAAGLVYAHWRRLEAMRPFLEATMLGLLLMVPVLASTYAAMSLAMPFADPLLHRIDTALGFDWLAFIRWVDQSPGLSQLLGYGYSSFALQLLVLPGLLCLVRQPGRAYQLVSAYVVLCLVSSAIGAFFPSVGAYVTYGIEGADLRHINGVFGHHFLDTFNAIRSGNGFTLTLENAAGIVTFPSVHAGMAAICAWAAWPSRLLRWPFLALNVIMAVSAITHGAHYLIDPLAGGLAALLTVRLVHRATARLRPAALPALPEPEKPAPAAA